jgi:hypothetical protein
MRVLVRVLTKLGPISLVSAYRPDLARIYVCKIKSAGIRLHVPPSSRTCLENAQRPGLRLDFLNLKFAPSTSFFLVSRRGSCKLRVGTQTRQQKQKKDPLIVTGIVAID